MNTLKEKVISRSIFIKISISFSLKIRHKPSGEAGQHNYTTLISWGELSNAIKERNLTNRLLNLYRFNDSEDTFRLEIV